MAETYTYFLARRGSRAPLWISPLQWMLLAAFLAVAYWISFGRGMTLIAASFYNYYGVFTEEVVWRVGVFPNLGLTALAVFSLLAWLQAVWGRCGVSVTAEGDTWAWTGRRGPKIPRLVARTPGGAWVLGEGRWWYVPHGFMGGDGRDWLSACGAPPAPLFHWRRFASPLALGLVVLLTAAWAAQWPIRENRRLRSQLIRAVVAGRAADAEALVRRHPEARPWLRYMESLPRCGEARCLREQIVARLEGLSIGPFYGGDAGILIRLLAINGWPELALRLIGPERPEALETLIRLDLPEKARALPRTKRRGADPRGGEMEAALLLEEGRFEEGFLLVSSEPEGRMSQRTAILRGVLANLTGRCGEAERMAQLLLAPDSLAQPRLDGDAPATGLGALQRVARPVRTHVGYSVALVLLGHLSEAREEWRRAEVLADRAGLPGLLDLDRALLRRLAPDGPWSAPPPPHRKPASRP